MDRFDPALISVVLACRDDEATVETTVECALGQTWPQLQIVAVDDGSADATPEILRACAMRHPERMRLLHLGRAGRYAARNHGLAHADGNYIAFLEPGQRWHPEALNRLHAALEDAAADIAYCGWQQDEAIVASAAEIPLEFDAAGAITHALQHGPWPLNCALVRRQLIDAARGFSERAPTAMDYDLWLRLFAAEPKLVRVPEALAFHSGVSSDERTAPRWRQVFDACAVRRDFTRQHMQRFARLAPGQRRALIRGPLVREAYRCHWRGDGESARRLFRRALRAGGWQAGDLKHLIASLLPAPLYRMLVDAVARRRSTS